MQTKLAGQVLATDWGKEADSILRSCVHCGFCTATCPTYLLQGDELDGPRGRIYLIKDLLETGETNPRLQQHLDRCLSCQSCETTCPSGVQYTRLLDLSKAYAAEKQSTKTWQQRWRLLLQQFMSNTFLFSTSLIIGQFFRPLLPQTIKNLVPQKQRKTLWPQISANKKVLLLSGCIQKSARPATNAALAQVLAKLNVETIVSAAGCCGALAYALSFGFR